MDDMSPMNNRWTSESRDMSASALVTAPSASSGARLIDASEFSMSTWAARIQ